MPSSPGYLRQQAVAAIIGAVHNSYVAGAWDLEKVTTDDYGNGPNTTLTFAVGPMYPDHPDDRQRVTINVWEEKTS